MARDSENRARLFNVSGCRSLQQLVEQLPIILISAKLPPTGGTNLHDNVPLAHGDMDGCAVTIRWLERHQVESRHWLGLSDFRDLRYLAVEPADDPLYEWQAPSHHAGTYTRFVRGTFPHSMSSLVGVVWCGGETREGGG